MCLLNKIPMPFRTMFTVYLNFVMAYDHTVTFLIILKIFGPNYFI